MLNNKDTTLLNLKRLGLVGDESKIYLELLEKPLSHLELSRRTGVNRTKIYRLAENLAKRSLVTHEQGDSGVLLAAADPLNLEVELVTQEGHLKTKREIFNKILPTLNSIRAQPTLHLHGFAINTYDGIAGFKQMLWNELKTKGEILVFGKGTIQDLVNSQRWAEKHRDMNVGANYKVRELLNPGAKPSNFTDNSSFMEHNYKERIIEPSVLFMENQTTIYNDIVATYYWRGDQKVGFEVVNKAHAQMMRQVFENYWKLAKTKA